MPDVGDAAAHQTRKGPTMRASSATVDGYHLRVMIERMQREGASEREIVKAVEEAAGRPAAPTRRETRRWPARLTRARRRI